MSSRSLVGVFGSGLLLLAPGSAQALEGTLSVGLGLSVRLGPKVHPGLEVFAGSRTALVDHGSESRFSLQPAYGFSARVFWEGRDRLGMMFLIRGGGISEIWSSLALEAPWDFNTGTLAAMDAEVGVSARVHGGLGIAYGGDLDLGTLELVPGCGLLTYEESYIKEFVPLGVSAHATIIQDHAGRSLLIGVGPNHSLLRLGDSEAFYDCDL